MGGDWKAISQKSIWTALIVPRGFPDATVCVSVKLGVTLGFTHFGAYQRPSDSHFWVVVVKIFQVVTQNRIEIYHIPVVVVVVAFVVIVVVVVVGEVVAVTADKRNIFGFHKRDNILSLFWL